MTFSQIDLGPLNGTVLGVFVALAVGATYVVWKDYFKPRADLALEAEKERIELDLEERRERNKAFAATADGMGVVQEILEEIKGLIHEQGGKIENVEQFTKEFTDRIIERLEAALTQKKTQDELTK